MYMEAKNTGSILNLPVVKQIEAFRVKTYISCSQKHASLVDTVKSPDDALNSAKRDIAYQATQNALPEDLRQIDEDLGKTGLKDARALVDYHANGICARFVGSNFLYYGVMMILALIILKALFKK